MGATGEGGFLSYWYQILTVTKEQFKEYWMQIVSVYVVLLIADLFIYYVYGRAKASEWTWSSAMTQAFPFTILVVGTTVIFVLLIAPYLLNKKTQEKVNELNEELGRYEDQESPKLRFFVADYPPYKILDGEGQGGKIWRFRVQVQNIGRDRLNNCAVILEGISPRTGQFAEKFLPRRLKLAADNPPDVLNTPHRQTFSLAPHAGKELIDVCQVDMRPDPNRTRIFIATEGYSDPYKEAYIRNGKYVLSLLAEADVGRPWGENFILDVEQPEPKFTRTENGS
jgi:hypothetical protein